MHLKSGKVLVIRLEVLRLASLLATIIYKKFIKTKVSFLAYGQDTYQNNNLFSNNYSI